MRRELETRKVSVDDLKKKIFAFTPFPPQEQEEMLYRKFDEGENFLIVHHDVRYVVVYSDLVAYFASRPTVLPGEALNVDPIGTPVDEKAALPKKSRKQGKDAKMPRNTGLSKAVSSRAGMGKASKEKAKTKPKTSKT